MMPVKKNTRKPTQQQMVDFGTSVTRFWTNYVNFDGTAQRSEFWFWVLFNVLVSIGFAIIGLFNPVFEDMLVFPWWVATFIPWLSLYSRRFHDAGFSAKWLWVPILCMICIFMLAVFLLSGDFESLSLMFLLLCMTMVGFSIFWFIVCVMPSKLKDNPYRK